MSFCLAFAQISLFWEVKTPTWSSTGVSAELWQMYLKWAKILSALTKLPETRRPNTVLNGIWTMALLARKT